MEVADYLYGSDDEEERQADAYALELLTGNPEFHIEKRGGGSDPDELANNALAIGHAYRVDPGTVILCYAKSTGEWDTAGAAMKKIYEPYPVWKSVNNTASDQLDWDALMEDEADFLGKVMGLGDDDG